MIDIKSKREIELIRESCRITAMALFEIEKRIKAGMSTMEISKIAEKVILQNGAIPSFKGYPSMYKGVQEFKETACVSINDEVIHGIPSYKRIIQDGDIVSVDIGAYKNGFHGDMARTIIIGSVDNEIKKLVEVTRQSFYEGIKFAKTGYKIGDISHAIGSFVEKNGYSIVKAFEGHRCGKKFA